jgi:hypothetical protein
MFGLQQISELCPSTNTTLSALPPLATMEAHKLPNGAIDDTKTEAINAEKIILNPFSDDTKSSMQSPFLRLPRELRGKIYSYVVVYDYSLLEIGRTHAQFPKRKTMRPNYTRSISWRHHLFRALPRQQADICRSPSCLCDRKHLYCYIS